MNNIKRLVYLSCILLFASCQKDQSGFYNVIDYGAKGDSITQDRFAIQKAIDAAYENGGGTVIVPAPGIQSFRFRKSASKK